MESIVSLELDCAIHLWLCLLLTDIYTAMSTPINIIYYQFKMIFILFFIENFKTITNSGNIHLNPAKPQIPALTEIATEILVGY